MVRQPHAAIITFAFYFQFELACTVVYQPATL